MGPLFFLVGAVLWGTAAVQAADARGRIKVRSYPFVRSESTWLKWLYVSWLVIGGFVAIILGFFMR